MRLSQKVAMDPWKKFLISLFATFALYFLALFAVKTLNRRDSVLNVKDIWRFFKIHIFVY